MVRVGIEGLGARLAAGAVGLGPLTGIWRILGRWSALQGSSWARLGLLAALDLNPRGAWRRGWGRNSSKGCGVGQALWRGCCVPRSCYRCCLPWTSRQSGRVLVVVVVVYCLKYKVHNC